MAQTTEHAGLVTRPDLAHVDARVELGGQIAHETAEVHAIVRGEVEGRMRLVERELDGRGAHVEVILIGKVMKDGKRFLVARSYLVGLFEVFLGCDADDRLERLGELHLFDIDDIVSAQANFGALACLDQHVVSRLHVKASRVEPIVLGRVAKSNGRY